jgi:hypothetical protein
MQMIGTGIPQSESNASPWLDPSSSADSLGTPTDEDNRQRYLMGEYTIILQLVRVLPFGRLSKHLVDRAVDACNHIQDIRGAIYDFKLRTDSLEVGSKKYEALLEVGLNYMIRYFYLVTFANYLVERDEKKTSGVIFPSFSAWLSERREITNIIQHSNQELN